MSGLNTVQTIILAINLSFNRHYIMALHSLFIDFQPHLPSLSLSLSLKYVLRCVYLPVWLTRRHGGCRPSLDMANKAWSVVVSLCIYVNLGWTCRNGVLLSLCVYM